MTRSPHPDAELHQKFWRTMALYLGLDAAVLAVLWSLR